MDQTIIRSIDPPMKHCIALHVITLNNTYAQATVHPESFITIKFWLDSGPTSLVLMRNIKLFCIMIVAKDFVYLCIGFLLGRLLLRTLSNTGLAPAIGKDPARLRRCCTVSPFL